MSAGRAFAWEFGRGHRVVLACLAVYTAAFWALVALFAPGGAVRLAPPDGRAAFLTVPVTFAAFYFVGVFTFGLTGDIAARESIFPRRLFTLPLTSAALAAWPMLYGCAAMASLWLVVAATTRGIGANVTLPWAWPALFGAAVMAWMQALTWRPYGLRGLRVVACVLYLAAIDVVVFVAVDSHAATGTLLALLAPQLPLAYLVAWNGVARARRGEVPDWTGRVSAAARAGGAAPGFTSAGRAQAWFEWRRHGRALPVLVTLVVPAELLLLFIRGNDTAPIVFLVIFLALLSPPFLAVFAAPALSTPTPFAARRPVRTAELVAAKIVMTLRSTLTAWALVVTFIVAALAASGRMAVVVERLRTGSEVTGALRMTAVVLAVLAALVASTWKHLVQSMCVGLSGRDWLIKGSVVAALVAVIALWLLVDLVLTNRQAQAMVWNALPWILVALVLAKTMAGGWVAVRLHDSRLLGDRALVAGAACWLGTVLLVYAGLVWFADSPAVPRYFLGAIAILSVPLARVAAAPLALEWGRHG
jgi:hypothetical protein